MEQNIKNVNQEYDYIKKGKKHQRIITTTQDIDLEGLKTDRQQLEDSIKSIDENVIKYKKSIERSKEQKKNTISAIEIIDDILNNFKE